MSRPGAGQILGPREGGREGWVAGTSLHFPLVLRPLSHLSRADQTPRGRPFSSSCLTSHKPPGQWDRRPWTGLSHVESI